MHSLFIVNSFHTAQSALRVSDSGKNKNTCDDGSAFRQNKHPGVCPWICLLDGMQKNRMKYLRWLRYLTTPQILDVFTRFFFFFKVLETVLGSHNNVVKRLGSCHLPIPTPGPFPCFLFPLLHKCQPDEDDHALSCLYAFVPPFLHSKELEETFSSSKLIRIWNLVQPSHRRHFSQSHLCLL